ncbi:MAG: 4-(cytidine 5'-diphospho)-2-C-methyl-D-erythritol kinase [Candidatus Omnitrophica bacterium]|nr:4-(cytidine 5'-diphospho)-2-C-methyl-D-erythritol kinase [Candidatus Omnitrophota bacterium]
MKLVISSPAKVNLYLKVLGKRSDKYHELITVFEKISLKDIIILKSRIDSRITISSCGEKIPDDKTNLAFKAAKLLQETYKINKGIDIRIEKNIPVGSGLGGGSSNAAVVLLGLNKLWKIKASKTTLSCLAAKIGSDCAFFIQDNLFALGKGRGEKVFGLKYTPGKPLWHILCILPINVSTALIYNKFDSCSKPGLTSSNGNVKMLLQAIEKSDLRQLGESLFNSLEAVTFGIHPRLCRIKEYFYRCGAIASLMSGSGSCVFGLASSKSEAERIAGQIRKRFSVSKVFVCHTASK